MVGQITKKIALNALYYSGLQAMGRSWTSGLGSILMLHHTRDVSYTRFAPNAHLSVSPGFLREQLLRLKRNGTEFLTMDQVHERLSGGREPKGNRPFVAVTLDDGYRDNLNFAVPIFHELSIPYTIYVAPGLVDGTATLWWEDLERIIAKRSVLYVDLDEGRREFDTGSVKAKEYACCELVEYLTHNVGETRHAQIVRDLAKVNDVDIDAHREEQVMNWSEIVELSKDPLCTIGAHSVNHAWMSRLSEEQVVFELEESARVLHAEVGYKPSHFAYPYGMADAAGAREFNLAKKCGYKTAVTTRHGVVHDKHRNHLTALPRISLNGNFQAGRYLSTLTSGIPTLINNKGTYLDVG